MKISRNTFLQSKWTFAAFASLSIAILLITPTLFGTSRTNFVGDIFQKMNRGIEGVLFARLTQITEANNNITVVTIDDATLSDENGLGRWQDFRRAYYARVIDHLARDGAIVIGLDALFSEKADPEDDAIFEKSLRSAGNVVMAFHGAIDARRDIDTGNDTRPTFPLPIFSQSARSLGYIDTPTREGNPVVDSIVAIHKVEGRDYEPFSLATFRAYLDAVNAKTTAPTFRSLLPGYYRYYPGYSTISLIDHRSRSIFVQYLHLVPSESRSGFRRLSFVDVYRDTYNPEDVRGKIVLIGPTATALTDRVLTPFAQQPGVYVHANMINTLFAQKYLTYIDPLVEYIFLGGIIILMTFLLVHIDNRMYHIGSSFIGIILFGAFQATIFFVFGKIFQYPAQMYIAIILVGAFITAYKYVYEERGKRLLKNTLSQYLAADLVSSVLENYEEVKLGGTRKEITTFFSDIKSFTTLSETFDPEEVVRFLSLYLQAVSDVIIDHKGFINKYEGDAVMALWGVFGNIEEQTVLACRSALAQQSAISALNPELEKRYGFTIEVRMGLNRGAAIVGNIGSSGRKIEYTAIGDSVNTASRLEGINKVYGTTICASEIVKHHSSDEFIWRELDTIRLKGKEQTTRIYELCGYTHQMTILLQEKHKLYAQALEAYRQGNISYARSLFIRCRDQFSDPPATSFLERIEALGSDTVPQGWEPVYRALEK